MNSRELTPDEKQTAQRIIDTFFSVGAKSPATAKTLADLGIERSPVLDDMIDERVVRRVKGDPQLHFIPFFSRDLFFPKEATKYSLIGAAVMILILVLHAVWQQLGTR